MCVCVVNVSRNTSGKWILGRQLASSWINNTLSIFCFIVKWGNISNFKMNFLQLKCHFRNTAPQITLITSRKLQMSHVCSVLFRHISCLVQLQCCQLILHINGIYRKLHCRHDSPFSTSWLSESSWNTEQEEYLDAEKLWLQLWDYQQAHLELLRRAERL